MLENDRMEKSSTEVTSIWRRNDINKSTWRTHRYFVDFESRIDGEISTSNRCHNFHVESPFKIDVISTNFPRGISTSNRWRIDEDESIGYCITIVKIRIKSKQYVEKFLTRHHLVKKWSMVSNASISTSFSNFAPPKMLLTVSSEFGLCICSEWTCQ